MHSHIQQLLIKCYFWRSPWNQRVDLSSGVLSVGSPLCFSWPLATCFSNGFWVLLFSRESSSVVAQLRIVVLNQFYLLLISVTTVKLLNFSWVSMSSGVKKKACNCISSEWVEWDSVCEGLGALPGTQETLNKRFLFIKSILLVFLLCFLENWHVLCELQMLWVLIYLYHVNPLNSGIISRFFFLIGVIFNDSEATQ